MVLHMEVFLVTENEVCTRFSDGGNLLLGGEVKNTHSCNVSNIVPYFWFYGCDKIPWKKSKLGEKRFIFAQDSLKEWKFKQ